MQAIILQNGKQYNVECGQNLIIDRIQAPIGEMLKMDQVLLLKSEDQCQIGTPFVEGAQVTAEVLDHLKGDKIRVFKMKRRKNYRRTIGSRPHLTQLKIISVDAS